MSKTAVRAAPFFVFLIFFGYVFTMLITSCTADTNAWRQHQAECASLGGQWVEGGKHGDSLCVAPDGRVVKVYK